MDNKEFKKRVKKIAKKHGVEYRETRQGKGSHSRVYYGERFATDALIAALGGYMEDKREIPEPSPLQTGQEMGYLRPLEAAKLALYIAMRKEGLSNIGLANRCSVDEKSVRRMLNLDHPTKIETIHKALRSVFSNCYDLVTSLETKEKTKPPENREGNLSSLESIKKSGV